MWLWYILHLSWQTISGCKVVMVCKKNSFTPMCQLSKLNHYNIYNVSYAMSLTVMFNTEIRLWMKDIVVLFYQPICLYICSTTNLDHINKSYTSTIERLEYELTFHEKYSMIKSVLFSLKLFPCENINISLNMYWMFHLLW